MKLINILMFLLFLILVLLIYFFLNYDNEIESFTRRRFRLGRFRGISRGFRGIGRIATRITSGVGGIATRATKGVQRWGRIRLGRLPRFGQLKKPIRLGRIPRFGQLKKPVPMPDVAKVEEERLEELKKNYKGDKEGTKFEDSKEFNEEPDNLVPDFDSFNQFQQKRKEKLDKNKEKFTLLNYFYNI